jgi:hypothetical protein
MPRIGRRSNPPTQRIELPIARGGTTPDSAAPGGTTPGSSAEESTARDTTVPDSAEPTGITWSTTGGAAAPAASDGTAASRTNDAAGGHVPGGPTADPDGSEVRPKPFIEGGGDPKIR